MDRLVDSVDGETVNLSPNKLQTACSASLIEFGAFPHVVHVYRYKRRNCSVLLEECGSERQLLADSVVGGYFAARLIGALLRPTQIGASASCAEQFTGPKNP